jgi:hypothetical protein
MLLERVFVSVRRRWHLIELVEFLFICCRYCMLPGIEFHLRSSHKLGNLHRFQEMATEGHYASASSFLYNIY